MMDNTLYYYKHCRVEFGTYVETHEDEPPTNTMAEMLQGGIYLGPTTKFLGICKSLITRTGRIITRNKFTPLPMPQYVIKKVEDMSTKGDCDEELILTDTNGSTLEVYDDDVNTHDIIAGVDNNYNDNNNNYTAYEDGVNEVDGTTYEDGFGTNVTNEERAIYPPTPTTNNTPDNN